MKFTTAKQTEQAAYEQVKLTPFTQIQGRPTRLDRNTLREECCTAASEVDMPFEECGDYGLLGEIMEEEEYTEVTGLEYAAPDYPGTYDEEITEDMDDHERKTMEAAHTERLEAWHTRKGALRGICASIREAMDEKYDLALKRPIIAYKKVEVTDYIHQHDTKWCKLDTKVKKAMKEHYYRGWEVAMEENIDDYIKRLNEEQIAMLRDGVKITTDDKLQHFMEQMYDCGNFDRRDFRDWEEQIEEEKLESMIENGADEQMFKQAILDQGRGLILDTVEEIQERHKAVRELERRLLDLHQIFLDMSVLVDAQGEMIDDIQEQVSKSTEYVKQGQVALVSAREYQKNTRKWACVFTILMMIVLLVILLPILKPWK